MDYRTRPLSRNKIRDLADFIRVIFKVDTIYFPVLRILDEACEKFDGYLTYEVIEDDKFENGVQAYLETSDYKTYNICIRSSVYKGALKQKGDCLGFINHEIAHFFLLHVFDIKPVFCCLKNDSEKIEPYESAEWQAMALCGELMIPYEKCKNKTLDEIVNETYSSREQAKYFKNNICNERRRGKQCGTLLLK